MNVAEDYVKKLGHFGVKVKAEQVLTSSEATASYLRRTQPDLEEVYAVGEAGLHRALSAQNFNIISPQEVRKGARPSVVVSALMRDSLSYEVLAMATLAVNNGASIVATNADSSYPTELGMMPGAGAVLSVITTATGATPTVIGKPKSGMFEEALRRLDAEAQNSAMDRRPPEHRHPGRGQCRNANYPRSSAASPNVKMWTRALSNRTTYSKIFRSCGRSY